MTNKEINLHNVNIVGSRDVTAILREIFQIVRLIGHVNYILNNLNLTS